MLVAAILVHVHFGFFINWLGNQKGEGIEYDLLPWAIARRDARHVTQLDTKTALEARTGAPSGIR
jgi:hypothetical protein